MKKLFFLFTFLALINTSVFADCTTSTPCYQTKSKPCEIDKPCDTNCSKSLDKKSENFCGKFDADDDEYCIYNECYLDRRFRIMKKKLCLTDRQECNIDSIYKKFKSDMEILHSCYRIQKNKVLSLIECSDNCYKEEIQELKELKKDIRNRMKCFKDDVKAQLCKNQYKAFNKFNRQEKRKIKKIVKYGAIYKLPCDNCCKK